MKDLVLRLKQRDGRIFHGHAIAAEGGGIGRVIPGVEVCRLGVVLHQQRSAVLDIVQQALVVFLHVLAGVVGAYAEYDSSETLQVSARHILRRQQRYV